MAENTVTKRDLAKAVAEENGLTQNEAHAVIQSLQDQIIEELSVGSRIELRDFGVFEPRLRKGRDNARNPRTGAAVRTDDGVTVKFKTGELRPAFCTLDYPKIQAMFNSSNPNFSSFSRHPVLFNSSSRITSPTFHISMPGRMQPLVVSPSRPAAACI